MEKESIIAKKVVIIGGSAGSLEVLIDILPSLKTINFALVLVLHRRSNDGTLLEELITMKTKIPVEIVEDKTVMVSGKVYIAPSDYHLLFEKNGLLSLDISEKIQYSRPSIDVSFESAADAYGPSLVGILLSGANNDGTKGLQKIKENNGITAVQDPESAEVACMPQSALTKVSPDYILKDKEILKFLNTIQEL